MADPIGEEEVPRRLTHREKNAEYFASLEKWLDDVRTMTFTCNLFPGFPFGMMMGVPPGSTGIPGLPLPSMFPVPPVPPMMFPPNFANFPVNGAQPRVTVQPMVEYRIPPLWKRFSAEVIDFLFLIVFKIAITYMAVDFFDFIDLDRYELDEVLQNPEKLDYQFALDVTSEILVLELIHRFVVCWYETCSLACEYGATPGKIVMRLRVVNCQIVVPGALPNVAHVFPGTQIGYGQSFCRAMLKNLLIALLFPLFVPLFFKKFNRAGYDVICRTIVVEDNRPRPL